MHLFGTFEFLEVCGNGNKMGTPIVFVPGGSPVKHPPTTQELLVQSLNQEDPHEEEMAAHCRIQGPEKSHGQRSLVCCGPRGLKELDKTEHKHACTHYVCTF